MRLRINYQDYPYPTPTKQAKHRYRTYPLMCAFTVLLSTMNPIEKFEEWYQAELEVSSVRIPSACCLSSIGQDGYPNARFVSLKEVVDGEFVITGPLNSRKGVELLANPKASLVFWWPETGRQIRIQGTALPLDTKRADQYFKGRNRDSQIVSLISQQGHEISDPAVLTEELQKRKSEEQSTPVRRPTEWSGFSIKPLRIEFMEFNENRLHGRELFSREGDHWNRVFLQP